MRYLLIIIWLSFASFGRGQTDTLYLNRWQAADSIYGNLTQYVNTGFLSNRVHCETGIIPMLKMADTLLGSADAYYQLMLELSLMSLDSNAIPSRYDLYHKANQTVGKYHFEEERFVYPMGIMDYNYNELDVNAALGTGTVYKLNHSFFDLASGGANYSTKNVTMIAPLFDYINNQDVSLVFYESDFRSNYRSASDIESIEILKFGNWLALGFNEEFQVPLQDTTVQKLSVRLKYLDGNIIQQEILINTPELPQQIGQPKSELVCDNGNIKHGSHQLQYCRVKACGEEVPIKKPYIILTGYRPPIFGQSFETTWQYYNDEQQDVLDDLISQGYDVFLVRYNMQEHPQTLGLNEMTDLLIDFIHYLNDNKVDDYENIISASSMSSDVARLALLKMEKYHQWYNSKHHHTRLLIHFDGNLYEANLPYGSLLQIYSGYMNPSFVTSSLESTFLKTFLFATLEQKATKELLQYHPTASISLSEFYSPGFIKTFEPTLHPLRKDFNDLLDAFDNGKHFIPMPNCRNIAISLGKIKGQNNVLPTNNLFNETGDFWVSSLDHVIRTAQHSSNALLFFKRYEPSLFIVPMNHTVYVKEMLPIDNASGSYLSEIGNILAVTLFAYKNEFNYTLPDFNSSIAPLFSHKSVVTALAINKSIWEPQHTMTLDIQSINLMYQNYSNLNSIPPIQSNYFGYPNLGRPNDHFQVTPMEAIYVDEEIDPHIRLNESGHVSQLVGFIKSEVEPSWLYLQNQQVGSQVKPGFHYRVKRQAQTALVTGHLVTPQTDPGDYIIEHNGIATLQAGMLVDLLPGTTFENGSDVTVIINYENCINGGRIQSTDNMNETSKEFPRNPQMEYENNVTEIGFTIVPNPGMGTETVISKNNFPIESLEVYDICGNLIIKRIDINELKYHLPITLMKGTYIIRSKIKDKLVNEKLIVL